MPYLERTGEPTIHYEYDDFTDPWKKAPVLLLQHGYSRAASIWYQWIPYLSRYYRIVRMDLRGLGKSSTDFDLKTGMTAQHFVDDILAVIDAVGGGPVHYCGESLGGILGMILAAEHPEKLRTLTLIAAPLRISDRTKKDFSCGHASWAAYCSTVAGLTKTHSNRLITCVEIRQVIARKVADGDGALPRVIPTGEWQMRSLSRLETSDQQSDAWFLAVKRAGGQPTPAMVSQVVDGFKAPDVPARSVKPSRMALLADAVARLREVVKDGRLPEEIEAGFSRLECLLGLVAGGHAESRRIMPKMRKKG